MAGRLAALALICALAGQPARSRAPALPATVAAERGEWIVRSDLEGRVVIVNLWASWCAPCLEELRLLDAVQLREGTGRLRILALMADPSDSQSALARDWPFRGIALVRRQALPNFRHPDGLPANYVFNREGRLVASNRKAFDRGSLTAMLRRMLPRHR